jgi:hypothetical protein
MTAIGTKRSYAETGAAQPGGDVVIRVKPLTVHFVIASEMRSRAAERSDLAGKRACRAILARGPDNSPVVANPVTLTEPRLPEPSLPRHVEKPEASRAQRAIYAAKEALQAGE